MKTSQSAWFAKLTFQDSRTLRPLSHTAHNVLAEVTHGRNSCQLITITPHRLDRPVMRR